MLLVIHNLPSYMRYMDVKSLILSKCGVSEIILDNLTNEGERKKVTLGLAEEGDAAIIVRKLNGLFLDGAQLYVEDVRQKKEQPYRPSQELVAEMSQKSFPGYQTQQGYYGTEADANTMAMNMSMMYNSMAMGGMYYMPMSANGENSFMNHGQQASVSEYPVRSLDYLSNSDAGANENKQSYMGRNPSPKGWDNQSNVTSNTGWDSRLPFFAQTSSADNQRPAQRSNDRDNHNAARNSSPEKVRSQIDSRSQRCDNYDRNIRVSLPNDEWQPNPNSFDLEPQKNANPNRFDVGPKHQTNPNSFDIEPRRHEMDSRSYQDRKRTGSHAPMDRRTSHSTKRAADRNDWAESQPKRMAAYPDRSSYPQDNEYNIGLLEQSSHSQDAQPNRKRDVKPAYQNRFNKQGGSDTKFDQAPTKQGTSYYSVGKNTGPPKRGDPVIKSGPAFANQGSSNTQGGSKLDANESVKALHKSVTWRGQVASALGKEMMRTVKTVGLLGKEKIFNKLKACIRTRLGVMLGDRLDIKMEEMHEIYRRKYPNWDDRTFFFQVVEMVKNDSDQPKDLNRGNNEDMAPRPKSNIETATLRAEQVHKPNAQFVPQPKAQFVPKPKAPFVPKPKAPFVPKPKRPGTSTNVEPFTPQSIIKPSKSVAAATKKIAKMEHENPDMYTLKPHLQKYVDEELDKIYELFMSVVQTPDNDMEEDICNKIANGAALEAKSLVQLNLTKRLLNISTGLMVSIFGKVNKQALSEFLEQYDATSVNSSKKGGMFVAKLSSFKKYDELCALGTAFIDGCRINIKPLHVSGPPSKLTKQEIAMNRRNFIKSQIKPFETKETPKTNVENENTLVKSELAQAAETETLAETEVKPEATESLQSEPSETKTAIKVDIAETIGNEKPNNDDIEATTKVTNVNTLQNLKSESNSNDHTNDDTNNDGVNDKENDNIDIPNVDNMDFDPDNVDVDENDLEDY